MAYGCYNPHRVKTEINNLRKAEERLREMIKREEKKKKEDKEEKKLVRAYNEKVLKEEENKKRQQEEKVEEDTDWEEGCRRSSAASCTCMCGKT
jgi:hypothetical protein